MSQKKWRHVIHSWLNQLDQSLLTNKVALPYQMLTHDCKADVDETKDKLSRIIALQKERGITSLKRQTTLLGMSEEVRGNEVVVAVKTNTQHSYSQNDELLEEQIEDVSMFVMKEANGNWKISSLFADLDLEKMSSNQLVNATPSQKEASTKGTYDPEKAVAYANTWWNTPNPRYLYFSEDNCTNYVSQCLYAGGMSMEFDSNEEHGWWYKHSPLKQNDKWSHSWAVAHAFYWYMKEKRKKDPKITLTEVPAANFEEASRAASQLELGDVIQYNWTGKRWAHSVFVVAFDNQGEPLVNANSNNSSHRYWAYQDSSAFEPTTKYAFFHIDR